MWRKRRSETGRGYFPPSSHRSSDVWTPLWFRFTLQLLRESIDLVVAVRRYTGLAGLCSSSVCLYLARKDSVSERFFTSADLIGRSGTPKAAAADDDEKRTKNAHTHTRTHALSEDSGNRLRTISTLRKTRKPQQINRPIDGTTSACGGGGTFSSAVGNDRDQTLSLWRALKRKGGSQYV